MYVAFVIDAYSRRILGWRSATAMTTQLVLDAIDQAIWNREREGVQSFSGLIHHNDRGSPNTRWMIYYNIRRHSGNDHASPISYETPRHGRPRGLPAAPRSRPSKRDQLSAVTGNSHDQDSCGDGANAPGVESELAQDGVVLRPDVALLRSEWR